MLRNTVNWCFSENNIRMANCKITDVIQALALANNYVQQPPLIHSSSDGRKVTVAVDSVHASYSYKYFGQEKGVTDYTFISQDLSAWASKQGIQLEFIQPGNPQQNVYVERYNRTVRYSWLCQHLFDSIKDVQDYATQWLWFYNNECPNKANGGLCSGIC